MAAAADEGATIIIPATVVAEIWREPPSHPSVTLIGTADAVEALDLTYARAVGALNGRVGATQITDAHVALLATRKSPSIVITSDVNDIVALVRANGSSASVGTKSGKGRAVHIEPM